MLTKGPNWPCMFGVSIAESCVAKFSLCVAKFSLGRLVPINPDWSLWPCTSGVCSAESCMAKFGMAKFGTVHGQVRH